MRSDPSSRSRTEFFFVWFVVVVLVPFDCIKKFFFVFLFNIILYYRKLYIYKSVLNGLLYLLYPSNERGCVLYTNLNSLYLLLGKIRFCF